ncbi:MAG: type II toxin-antitoxin system VapC family toxin [Pirellulales bacterium]|nr:type II toxin-antitoxin system VapC family toxin [Pirellulales bacterium]
MRRVFLDTVGLLAVWDAHDQWHAAAEPTFLQLLQAKIPLVTTEYVLLECGNAAARRPYRKRVSALRQQLEAAGLIESVTATELTTAWAAFDRGDAAGAGIVDQISFAVMRRLGLTEAFTNDQHFATAGFTILF